MGTPPGSLEAEGDTAMRKLLRGLIVTALILLPVAPAALAAGDIVIKNPWAWSSNTPQQRTGAAYLTIINRGLREDRLLGASSPLARSVMLHETIRDGDILRMRPVKALNLPPGEPIVMRPGSRHLMLTGLRAPLEHGVSVPLTLIFKRAGRLTVQLTVHERSHHRDDSPPADDDHMHHQTMEQERQGDMGSTGPREPDFAPPGTAGGPREPDLQGMTPRQQD